MSLSHSTVTYTLEIDIDGSPFGIDLVPKYESEPSEAPYSPEHAPPSLAYDPDSLKYVLPLDDNLEPAEAHALLAPVLPTLLSPDYSADYKPIKDDPQEADPEDDPKQSGSTLAQGAIDRLVVAIEETDERVADLGTHYKQDNHEMRVIIEQEAAYARDAWSFAMDKIKVLQHQRQESDERLT
nr:hypothetical protein [Tanacetum cinerariifolium]